MIVFAFMILKMLLFLPIPLHPKEKNLLSLYHHQIIRALGTDFIGQCCLKA
jgi:hypothetical protein